jgi:predicted phage baseplate assembly protein
VADAVCRAVVAALETKHPLAPDRFVARTLTTNYVDLDTVYPRIVTDSWLLLSSPLRDELYHVTKVQQTSRTDFSLTGAVTRVKLEGNAIAPDSKGHNPYFNIRETAVFAGSEELALALDTINTPFTGDTIDVVGLPNHVPAGRDLLVVGTDAATGQPASDLVILKDTTLAPPRGTGAIHALVTFKEPVSRKYALDGLAVYGNVAYATHGETIRNEILGDGDGAREFQKFALKKKPVTYAPDDASGTLESSLTVAVNGVRWKEAPTLYGASPDEPIYTARIANDGTLTVRFGDGVTGSRLPSGRQNVVAQYRQGIGAAGRLPAGRLITPLDRPAGLRAATNPIAAIGGVEPESLDSARVTAPGTVRTFGRAVALKDFEDSTLTDGIVAKASATWVWTGERRAIHVTVGLVGGDVLTGPTTKRLMAKLDSERDTNHRLIIADYTRVPILVAARIVVLDRYVAARVLAAARAALMATLSFEARGFGQPVYLSDVYATLQHIEGVEYVDVDTLDLKSRDAAVRAAHRIDDNLGQPQPRLLMLAARADRASGEVLPAELAVVEADGDVALSSLGGVSE